MANGKAFHNLAVPSPQQQDLRGQDPVVTNAVIGQQGGRALATAATTIGRTDMALGACYRRLLTRTGRAKGVTATARKIAVLFYNAVRHGTDYVDPRASACEGRYPARVIHKLQRRAKACSFVLQPTSPAVLAAS